MRWQYLTLPTQHRILLEQYRTLSELGPTLLWKYRFRCRVPRPPYFHSRSPLVVRQRCTICCPSRRPQVRKHYKTELDTGVSSSSLLKTNEKTNLLWRRLWPIHIGCCIYYLRPTGSRLKKSDYGLPLLFYLLQKYIYSKSSPSNRLTFCDREFVTLDECLRRISWWRPACKENQQHA